MTDVCSIIRKHLLNYGILDEKHIILSFEDTTADTLISITQTGEGAPILYYSIGYALLRTQVTLRIRSPDRDKTWGMVSMISNACHNRTIGGIRMFRASVRDGGIIRTHTVQQSDTETKQGVESFLAIMEFRCIAPNNL